MKKIIITLLLMVGYTIGADRPTHYIDEKWRVCDEKTYDVNGNLIRLKYKDGSVLLYEYDSKGNLIHKTYPKGAEDWYEYEYDADGNLMCRIVREYGTRSRYYYPVKIIPKEPFRVEYNSKGNKVCYYS